MTPETQVAPVTQVTPATQVTPVPNDPHTPVTSNSITNNSNSPVTIDPLTTMTNDSVKMSDHSEQESTSLVTKYEVNQVTKDLSTTETIEFSSNQCSSYFIGL